MPTPFVDPHQRALSEPSPYAVGPFLVLPVASPPLCVGRDDLRQPLRALRTTLQHWHLLSLDAPTIATLWTALLARSAGDRLPAGSLTAMFLVVWLLYVSDRLLDARPLRTARTSGQQLQHVELEPRHRFHHRYRRYFLITLGGVAGVLGVLLPSLPIAALRLDLLLGAFLAGYFVIIHAVDGVRLPKEIAVGLFFAAAVFIPTISRRPELRPVLAPAALLLAAVCSFNCLAIYRWEHPELARPGHADGECGMSRPHVMTLWAINHLMLIGRCLLLVTVVTAFVPGPGRPACIAVAAAIAALLALDRGRHRFAPVTLRALADLALATALLVWPMTSLLPRR